MPLLGVLLVTVLHAPGPDVEPVLWLHPRGEVLVEGKRVPARLTAGARTVGTPYGFGLDVNGKSGGLLLGDVPALRTTGSMTVSAWLFVRTRPRDGVQGQILFRGDDRNALDPYTLMVNSDGTVKFAIQDAEGNGASVSGDLPFHKWTHIVTSYDDSAGELKLWVDDVRVATRPTTRGPFSELDAKSAPGVSIGNVQNDKGPHNQPLDGTIADLRLYSRVMDPSEIRPATKP